MLTSSGAKFENLLELSPIAMMGVDQEGVIRFANRLTEVLFGYDRDNLIGQSVEMLMPESFRKVHAVSRAHYLAHPGTRSMGASLETTGRRHDGSTLSVDISLSTIETEDGRLVIAAVRDVTHRQKENEHLQHLATLIEYSDDAMIGKTLDGIITSWNPAAERLYGYSSKEIMGQTISLLYPKDRPGELSLVLARIREGQRTEHLETTRVRKDGTVIPVDITVLPVRDTGGAIVGACTIARDVTNRCRS